MGGQSPVTAHCCPFCVAPLHVSAWTCCLPKLLRSGTGPLLAFWPALLPLPCLQGLPGGAGCGRSPGPAAHQAGGHAQRLEASVSAWRPNSQSKACEPCCGSGGACILAPLGRATHRYPHGCCQPLVAGSTTLTTCSSCACYTLPPLFLLPARLCAATCCFLQTSGPAWLT